MKSMSLWGWTLQGAAAFAVGFALLVSAGCGGTGFAEAPSKIEDWELRSIETGQVMNISQLRGKVVFLNLWATWCPPCVREMPSIERLAAKFSDNDKVAFVLVSLDKDASDVQEFMKKNGYHVSVYTPVGPIPPALQERNTIPATYILNGDGIVEKKHFESYEWDRKSVVDLITKLAGASKG